MVWLDDNVPRLDTTPRSVVAAVEPVPLCCTTGLCPSDVTADGLVDVNDLLALLSAYGTLVPGASGTRLAADIGGDGVVGVDDLLALLGDFGRAC